MPSESQTRKEIIDLRLKDAGWNVSDRTSHQLQFLGLLRDLLIDRGGIEKRDLIQSPFTITYPSGIRGVFSPAQITEILALTDRLAA